MEVADSADILNACSNLCEKIMGNFTKILKNFKAENCFKIFIISRNFSETINNKEDTKKLWEILRK